MGSRKLKRKQKATQATRWRFLCGVSPRIPCSHGVICLLPVWTRPLGAPWISGHLSALWVAKAGGTLPSVLLASSPPHQIGETLRRGEGAELRPFAWLPFSPGVPHVPCLLCSPGLVRLLGTWPPGHSPGGSRAGAYLFLGGAALHPRAPAAAPAQTLLQGCALLEATWVAIRAHPMWGLRTLPGTLHPVPT